MTNGRLTLVVVGRIICEGKNLFLEQIKWANQKRAGKSGLGVSRMR